jgi:hypothetical protein
MIKILLTILVIGALTSCSKSEKYASVIINGIEYAEIRESNPLAEAPSTRLMVFKDVKAAMYRTYLESLTAGYPDFKIEFWLLLDENSKPEINKTYKLLGGIVSREHDWRSTITRLKEDLPNGYDGIVYCFKDGVDESFLLEGTFELERYESNTEYYYGSYMLVNSTKEDEMLNIKGNFKFVENITQLDY